MQLSVLPECLLHRDPQLRDRAGNAGLLRPGLASVAPIGGFKQESDELLEVFRPVDIIFHRRFPEFIQDIVDGGPTHVVDLFEGEIAVFEHGRPFWG